MQLSFLGTTYQPHSHYLETLPTEIYTTSLGESYPDCPVRCPVESPNKSSQLGLRKYHYASIEI